MAGRAAVAIGEALTEFHVGQLGSLVPRSAHGLVRRRAWSSGAARKAKEKKWWAILTPLREALGYDLAFLMPLACALTLAFLPVWFFLCDCGGAAAGGARRAGEGGRGVFGRAGAPCVARLRLKRHRPAHFVRLACWATNLSHLLRLLEGEKCPRAGGWRSFSGRCGE